MSTRAPRSMTVAVPPGTYESFRQRAERASQSVEEAVVQAMQAALTTEASTAAERQAMLAVLESLDTPALWQLIQRGGRDRGRARAGRLEREAAPPRLDRCRKSCSTGADPPARSCRAAPGQGAGRAAAARRGCQRACRESVSRPGDTEGRRERLLAEAGYRCGYCRGSQRIMGVRLILDHLAPRAGGGADDEENLWPSCQPCNGFKQARIEARDPDSGTVAPLFNPRRQRWVVLARLWEAVFR